MHAHRMDDLSDFLRQRNVPEETIETLEQEKVFNFKSRIFESNNCSFHDNLYCFKIIVSENGHELFLYFRFIKL